MKEIIYDLLCVGKSHKTFAINPEVTQRADRFSLYCLSVSVLLLMLKFMVLSVSALPRG